MQTSFVLVCNICQNCYNIKHSTRNAQCHCVNECADTGLAFPLQVVESQAGIQPRYSWVVWLRSMGLSHCDQMLIVSEIKKVFWPVGKGLKLKAKSHIQNEWSKPYLKELRTCCCPWLYISESTDKNRHVATGETDGVKGYCLKSSKEVKWGQ